VSPLLPPVIADVDCVIDLANVQYLVVCYLSPFRVHVVALILNGHRHLSLPQDRQLRPSSLDSHPSLRSLHVQQTAAAFPRGTFLAHVLIPC
jgi:hypothetical protein